MTGYVKRVEAIGVHGRFDMAVDLEPGVNIVYGKNGAGKTTLVHILANALNGDFVRFVFLLFNRIQVELDDGRSISIRKQTQGDKEYIKCKVVSELGKEVVQDIPVGTVKGLLRGARRRLRWSARRLVAAEEPTLAEEVFRRLLTEQEDVNVPEAEPILPTAYFPAFRTMIDAWTFARQGRDRRREPEAWTALATDSAREWFGEFVPAVNYPSLLEIEQRLTDEIHRARLTIGRADREYLSEAFLDIFDSLSRAPDQDRTPDDILERIRHLFTKLDASLLQEESALVTRVYSRLRESIDELELAPETEQTAVRVLNVYQELLEKIVNVQEESFSGIQRYLESVNAFLEGKRLVVDPSIPRYRSGAVRVGFSDQTSTGGLYALSSGERQIVTMIYAATHMSEQRVVLIDEPEISLHVDWQRRLLSEMSAQIGNRQIVACTHSPVIGADYGDRLKEIELKPTAEPNVPEDDLEHEEIPF